MITTPNKLGDMKTLTITNNEEKTDKRKPKSDY